MPDCLGKEEALGGFRFGHWVAPVAADSVCSRHEIKISLLIK